MSKLITRLTSFHQLLVWTWYCERFLIHINSRIDSLTLCYFHILLYCHSFRVLVLKEADLLVIILAWLLENVFHKPKFMLDLNLDSNQGNKDCSLSIHFTSVL
jgi:hypothetical protein